MKANETKLQPLIEGTKQYLIPLFQRPYRWEKRQWQTLWKDIQDVASEHGDKSHFMGAIVTMPAQTVPEGITKYLLIDGQQRITTLLVLLLTIRDAAKRFPGTLADKIHELYLTNKYQEDLDYLSTGRKITSVFVLSRHMVRTYSSDRGEMRQTRSAVWQ